MVFENEELKFPVECHFKVISEDIDGIHFVIETVLMEMKINVPVLRGNKSAGGKYITHNITVMVHSKEMLTAIDTELRNIQGVKMVL